MIPRVDALLQILWFLSFPIIYNFHNSEVHDVTVLHIIYSFNINEFDQENNPLCHN